MKKQYAIQQTTKWVNKSGKECVMISYFREFVNVVLPMLSMESTVEKAKKYQTKAEAIIDLRKYFRAREGAKIIEINPD